MKACLSKSALTLLSVFLVFSAESNAQAKPKILVNPPPGEFGWTVKFKYQASREKIVESAKEDLAAKSLDIADLARPEKANYVIKKLVSKRTVDLEGGSKIEAFQWEKYEFQKSPQAKEIMMTDLTSYPAVEQLFRKTFPGVHWVTPELFVDVRKAYDQDCAYFRDGTPEKPNPDEMDAILDASKYEIREAWFNLKTGLPIAFKAGPVEGEFSFSKPASGDISLPSDVRAKMQEMAQYLDYMKRRSELGQQAATP